MALLIESNPRRVARGELDGYLADALVRLAGRATPPGALGGPGVGPAAKQFTDAQVCRACVAFQLEGTQPLQIELAIHTSADYEEPAWAVSAFAFNAATGSPVGCGELLSILEDDMDPIVPLAQFVASIDALDVSLLQYQLMQWLVVPSMPKP